MKTKRVIEAQVPPVVSNLFFTKPLPASNLYHIFRDNESLSLCGKFGMIRISEDMTTRVNGKEKYKKGEDCKGCFRKANLLI